MKTRVRWIDVVKCFGIFAIYLGHCTGDAGKAYEFVYTHHVALFFVLAGFTESLGNESNYGQYIIKIFKGMIVPWLMFSGISIIFCNVLLYDNSLQSVVDNVILVIKGTIKGQFMASSLWFITCLAVIKLIFFWIKRINSKLLIVMISTVIHFATVFIFPKISIDIPSLPYNIDSALFYLIYFAIGYCLYPKIDELLEKKLRVNTLLIVAMTSFSLYFSIRLYFGWDIFEFVRKVKYFSAIYDVIRRFFVIWLYIILAYLCQDIKGFNSIGKNTLYLCGSEYLGRVLIEEIGKMLNLPIELHNPLNTVLYTILLLNIVNNYIVPMEKMLLNKILWRYEDAKN